MVSTNYWYSSLFILHTTSGLKVKIQEVRNNSQIKNFQYSLFKKIISKRENRVLTHLLGGILFWKFSRINSLHYILQEKIKN